MEQQLNKYEVTMLDSFTRNKWTMMFSADNFGHAEEQAWDALKSYKSKDQIVSITREYE
jgi:hypothetical protein